MTTQSTETSTTSTPTSAPSYFIGVWGNNVLTGTGANEVFYAPGGTETLTGGGTHDVFVVDSSTTRMEITNFNPGQDVLSIGSSSGVSSLSALAADAKETAVGLEIDFSGGAVVVLNGITSVSALTATNTAFFGGAFTPPASAAPMTALSALTPTTPSYFIGKWGNSVMTGTGATEVFFAPGGKEVLTGGGSRDIFIVDSTTNHMEITNFDPSHDVLYVGTSAGVTSLQTLANGIHATASGLEIDFPSGAVVVLDGISSASQLNSSNTAFFQGAYTPPANPTSSAPPSSSIPPAVLTAQPVTLQTGQSVALSSLISVSVPDGQSVADYYFYDPTNSVQLNGATNLLGSSYSAKGYYEVSTSDFAKITYLAGTPGSATLQFMANDGTNGSWVKETITIQGTDTPPTVPPTPASIEPAVLTAQPATLQTGQSVALSSLISVSVPDGQSVADYYFNDPSNGVQLNGATNLLGSSYSAKGYYEVSASDFAKLTYLAGTPGSATLQFMANDGTNGSWVKETITIQGADTAPTVPPTPTSIEPAVLTAQPATLQTGQSVALSSLISVSVPDGQSVADYYFYDPSNGVQLNGATNLLGSAEQAKGYYEVSASDFAKLTYLAGTPGSATLQFMANDGTNGSWVKETITIQGADTAPTVPPTPTSIEPAVLTAQPATLQTGQSVALSSLISVSVPDGQSVADFYFYDPSNGVQLNGATNLLGSSYSAKGYYEVSASDFAKMTYLAGTPGSATLQFMANDGTNGSWVKETITIQGADTAPTVPPTPASIEPAVLTAQPATLQTGQSVALSSLISVSVPDGQSVADFYFYDPSNGVQLNGATNLLGSADQAKGYYEVSASDFAKLTYLAGSPGSATLQFMANDGTNGSWVKETITVQGAAAATTAPPLVGAANAVLWTNAWIPAVSLYAAQANGGATIEAVKFVHVGTGGGHFDLNGTVVDGASITITPDQAANLHYDSGTTAGTFAFQVSVEDSNGVWSGVATGHVSVSVPLLGLSPAGH